MQTISPHPYATALRAALAQQANVDLAGPMRAYMRDRFAFFGIKSPDRKAIVRAFVREHDLPTAGAPAIGRRHAVTSPLATVSAWAKRAGVPPVWRKTTVSVGDISPRRTWSINPAIALPL